MPPSAGSACVLLPALPQAVPRARRYARGLLRTWRLHAMADTVELLVSELVTNAVRATADGNPAGANPIYLCLSALGEVLLIEVWDVSGAVPLRRKAGDDDEDGRGLMLVKALSKEWGCKVLPTCGKIVWCKCSIGEPT